MALRKQKEAVATYKKALKIGRYPFLLEALGEALAASGDLEKAANRYAEAIEMHPRMASAYVALANIETARGRSSVATQLLDKALKLGVKDPNLFFGRGRLAAAGGDLDAALSYFDQALKQNPDMAAAFEGRGKALYQMGRADAALAPSPSPPAATQGVEAVRPTRVLDRPGRCSPRSAGPFSPQERALPHRHSRSTPTMHPPILAAVGAAMPAQP